MASALAAHEAGRCPAQDGFCGDAQEERGIARSVLAPGRRFRRRQPESTANTHDAVEELVLVGRPWMRAELPVGPGGELLKHAIVFVDETLVGGVVQSSRAGHLKAVCRDQEIA